MKVLAVASARPNYPKLQPVVKALLERDAHVYVLTTGQHGDELIGRRQDHLLRVAGRSSGTVHKPGISRAHRHADITALVAEWASDYDLVLVPGDVDGSLAAAIGARLAGVPVAHIEAGLRTTCPIERREMPEELNRRLIDSCSDWLFTTEISAYWNLRRESIGYRDPQIHIADEGNTMADSFLAELAGLPTHRWRAPAYALVTLHRPGLVDTEASWRNTPWALRRIADVVGRVYWPVHPRARRMAAKVERRVELLEPMEQTEFAHALRDAAMVITDSGGVQEEALIANVPCITHRTGTERRVTLDAGANRLTGLDPGRLVALALYALEQPWRARETPPGWDGHAGERIAAAISNERSRLCA